MKIEYTAIAQGNGKLKSGELNEFTKGISDDASITIETKKAESPMDTDSWLIKAEWDSDSGKVHKPSLSYAPGVRGMATDTAANY